MKKISTTPDFIDYTDLQQRVAYAQAKANILSRTVDQIEYERRQSDEYYERIQQVKEEQGEAFNPDSWDYKYALQNYNQAVATAKTYEDILNFLA